MRLSFAWLKDWTWLDQSAWLSSCAVHTLLLLIMALAWNLAPKGQTGTGTRPAAITLLNEVQSDDEEDVFLPGGSTSGGSGQDNQPVMVSVSANKSGPPVQIDDLVSSLEGTSEVNGVGPTNGLGDGSLGDGLHGTGRGSGMGRGSPTSTTFMGIKGTGSSFVYVLDRSDSMNGYDGAPLRYAKGELINSISSLQDMHQFQIVFYNDAPGALSSVTGGSGRLLFATDLDKQRATGFVRRLTGSGGTEHVPALKLGLAMAPEVLFFMTDAEEPSMSTSQLRDIQQYAERGGTTIHTIQFSAGPASNNGGWIRTLAEMNRGKYRYVDITSLNAEPVK